MLKTLAIKPTGVVANTVGVLGFKQPVLVKLANISKECNSVDLDFGTRGTCNPSSLMFQHKNDLYTLVICLPNNPINHVQLQDHKPFATLNRNTVVDVLKVRKGRRNKDLENPIIVDLKVRLKSPIYSDEPIVVPVMLIGLTRKASSLQSKSGRIFIFKQSSLRKKFSRVINHIFVAEKDTSGIMQAHVVLCGIACPTLFSYGDYIGQAELFNPSNPDHIQQCIEASTLQARV